jgi:hypothetical protein
LGVVFDKLDKGVGGDEFLEVDFLGLVGELLGTVVGIT